MSEKKIDFFILQALVSTNVNPEELDEFERKRDQLRRKLVNFKKKIQIIPKDVSDFEQRLIFIPFLSCDLNFHQQFNEKLLDRLAKLKIRSRSDLTYEAAKILILEGGDYEDTPQK